MATNRGDSDPLPFTQIDRAVKPKALLLANAIGVTSQHALGSLVEFWDLCGDPRDLTRLLETQPEKPEVVLSAQEVQIRFKLASGGCDVDPSILASIGLLEQKEVGVYRVRGMSRYFGVIAKRLHQAEAARKAGQASAESRRARKGSAQPTKPEREPNDTATPVERLPNDSRTTLERPSNDSRTPVERPSNDSRTSPERETNLEYRVQSTESSLKAFAGSPPAGAPEALELAPPPQTATHPKKPKATPADPRLAPLTERLALEYAEARGVPYAHGGPRDTQALKKLIALADDEEISARWRWAIVQPSHQWVCVSSFAQLGHKWNDIAAPIGQPRGSLHIVGRPFEGDILRGAS